MHSSCCRSILPHAITHRPSKRKASPGSEPLSEKRGKRPQSSIPVAERETANASTLAPTPASIQDVSSVIEEFTDVMVETPATKRLSRLKPRVPPEETSIVTTPGRADVS